MIPKLHDQKTKYDQAAISDYVLRHTKEHPASKKLREVRRVLRPDGGGRVWGNAHTCVSERVPQRSLRYNQRASSK